MAAKNRKKKKALFGKAKALSTAKEYCQQSSIHGFSYWVADGMKGFRKSTGSNVPQTERTVNATERIFWLLMTLMSFGFAGFILKSAIVDWIENPAGNTILNTLAYITTNVDRRGDHLYVLSASDDPQVSGDHYMQEEQVRRGRVPEVRISRKIYVQSLLRNAVL